MTATANAEHEPLFPDLFVEAADDGRPRLIGSRCAACGAIVFPKRRWCPLCLGGGASEPTMRAEYLGPEGGLYSFTISNVAPAGFEAPYFQAYVDLDAGPRVFTLVASDVPVEEGALWEGMRMELVVEPLHRGGGESTPLTYKCRPLRGGGDAR